jgi:hypothetical protein
MVGVGKDLVVIIDKIRYMKHSVFWDVMLCSLVEIAKIWRNVLFLPYKYFEVGEHTWSR